MIWLVIATEGTSMKAIKVEKGKICHDNDMGQT